MLISQSLESFFFLNFNHYSHLLNRLLLLLCKKLTCFSLDLTLSTRYFMEITGGSPVNNESIRLLIILSIDLIICNLIS